MPPSRSALLLTVLLLVLGTLRIAWMVTHQPMLGYANQYDTGRTSACLGLWPNLPEPARYNAHRESPISQHVEGQRRPAECYVSSELAFVSVAMAGWKLAAEMELARGSVMDLRWVGVLKAITLVLLGIGFTIALRERPLWMLAHAAVFGLVLADPFVTLWMNSLYTEFSAVLFGYAAVMCLVVIAGIAPDRIGWYLALGLALIGLGMSRTQHALLPLCLALLLLPVSWRYRRAMGISLIVVCVLVAIVQTVVIERPATLRAANNVDLVLGTLLPASRAPGAALAALELPPRCESMIGATWYVTMGEDLATRCPEAKSLRGARLLNLLATEPGIAVRVLAKAVPLMQTQVLQYLGIEEGKRFGTLDDRQSPLTRSIATPIESLPVVAYAGWQMFLFVALVAGLVTWLVNGIGWGTAIGPLVTTALAGIAWYATLTSLFDGYVELPRHAHLGAVASSAFFVVMVIAIVFGFATRQSQRIVTGAIVGRNTSVAFRLSLLAGALAVAMSAVLWIPAFRQQPLAIGVVDEPESNQLPSTRVLMHGWALDPLGPANVYALVNGATRIDARPWRHPTDPNGVEIARVFPRYREPAVSRFEIPVDTANFGGKPVLVHTFAANPDGVATEIDRRTLVPRSRP